MDKTTAFIGTNGSPVFASKSEWSIRDQECEGRGHWTAPHVKEKEEPRARLPLPPELMSQALLYGDGKSLAEALIVSKVCVCNACSSTVLYHCALCCLSGSAITVQHLCPRQVDPDINEFRTV